MVSIKPFAALRPAPHLAGQICELPYDVMSSAEARTLAAGRPLSFLRVSKPEIDLAPEMDCHAPEVYAKGAENFAWLQKQGALVADTHPCFYLYRQIMGRHCQLGLVAVASCADYLANRIKKHELTRVDKEDDRVRHIETLNAQTGPAFLTYRAVPALDALLAPLAEQAPAIDFTASDGVRHTSWVISDPVLMAAIEGYFAQMDCLYIADGHHRSAAAGRVFQSRGGQGGSGHFLSVIFPHNQLQILPYNRVLKDLNGLSPENLACRLAEVFDRVLETRPQPERKHAVNFYFGGRWQTFRFKSSLLTEPDAINRLDVTLLQRHVLDSIFGIDNPRTSDRVAFVGGIRGAGELERLVQSGEHACAFALHPTGIEDLMSIADAGGIMPPKSTWFEPKLRDAMFCHQL